MVLDQQVPMEKAFSGPLVIAQRMGGQFDAAKIAAMSEDDFVALCSERPAIHRFPAAMAKRVHQLCQVLTEDYDGRAQNIWKDATSGDEVKANLARLPGFGADKAAIFTAVLGKLRGVTPTAGAPQRATTASRARSVRWPTSSTTTHCRRCARPSGPSRPPRRRPANTHSMTEQSAGRA